MKAIIYTNYGSPDVLHLGEVPKPEPKRNEICIEVKATSVNRTDCANLTAKPFIMRFALGLFKPKKQILGTEFAGVVNSIGSDVKSYKISDKVFGFYDGILSSYAEYFCISEEMGMATMPKNTSYVQAAVSIEGAHYAYNMINKVNLKKGDKVLVNGASGGIGTATVQLLKFYGAHITAVTNTKNIDLVQSLGAEKVIDYTKEDFTTDDEKYEFVFDTVGKSTFGKCKKLMKPGGVYISSELGPMIQNVYYSIITALLGQIPGQAGKQVKFPYPPNIKRSVLLIKGLIEDGKYQSVIDRSYSLEEIPEAFSYVLKGQKTGNVVINVESES